MARGANPRAKCGHWGNGDSCRACLQRGQARTTVAPLAPNCPTPSKAMLNEGARFSRSCQCKSCTTRRAEYADKIRARNRMDQHSDFVVVDRLVDGGGARTEARICERRCAAIRMLLMDPSRSRVEIAGTVGLNPRSVERYAAVLELPSMDNKKRPNGETRAMMKELILANPRMSASRAGELLGIDSKNACEHHKKLVDAGELPGRTLADIDNPRFKGYGGQGRKL